MKELLLQNTRLDQRYDVFKLLGRGSYAEIFVARDTGAAPKSVFETVVIKALNVFLQEEPDTDLERTLIENFQNEAVALDRVRHPNVINRLGHGTARDLSNTIFHYLVLEYLPGGDLAEMCKRQPLSLEKTLFYLEQICRGLEHAHSKGVIHRDIKPNNLLLKADLKTVKIADFGVAKFNDFNSPITRVGTNIYAAPEHSPLNAALDHANNAGEFRLTAAADVYSLAKTVYALLTGESPRRFANQPILHFPEHLAGRESSQKILPVLLRATQTAVSQRTKTVAEFWREFSAAANLDQATNRIGAQNLAAAATQSIPAATIPARPQFDSQPNVQIAPPQLEQLPERPRRVVVEFDQPQTFGNNNVAPAVAAKDRRQNIAAAQTVDFQIAKPARETAILAAPAKSEIRPKFESVVMVRAKRMFKNLALRLATLLIILGAFAAILGATYTYLGEQGYLPAFIYSNSAVGREAIINATVINNSPLANLRAAAAADSRDIGDVPNGSRVRILSEQENWCEVQILQRAAPKKNFAEPDRGWISKKLLEIQ